MRNFLLQKIFLYYELLWISCGRRQNGIRSDYIYEKQCGKRRMHESTRLTTWRAFVFVTLFAILTRIFRITHEVLIMPRTIRSFQITTQMLNEYLSSNFRYMQIVAIFLRNFRVPHDVSKNLQFYPLIFFQSYVRKFTF